MSAVASDAATAARLGVHRALQPPRTLPHIAERLNADAPINRYEAEIDVELLNVDATSFTELRRHSGGDPQGMADAIAAIVAERGKLQNPVTGSGGVLLGRVSAIGAEHHDRDLAVGDLVVPLASLIAIPLSLSEVGPVDPHIPRVPVRGRAVVTGAMLCGRVPPDLPAPVALTVFDVYPAAWHVRELATHGGHVLVLGAGQAGLLALAAARAAVGDGGEVTVVDIAAAALRRARAVDPAANVVRADVTDPVAVASCVSPPADLTVVCTSVGGAEGAALLSTATRGTIVFFSTATRFAAAALGADAVGSQARLIIPSGLTDDRGGYSFELLRTVPALRQAFERGE